MRTYLLLFCVSTLISLASGSSTVVVLADSEILQLLQQLVFNQIDGMDIPYSLLVANGLNHQSILDFLFRLGYFVMLNR